MKIKLSIITLLLFIMSFAYAAEIPSLTYNGSYVDYSTVLSSNLSGTPKCLLPIYNDKDGTLTSLLTQNDSTVNLFSLDSGGNYSNTNLTASFYSQFYSSILKVISINRYKGDTEVLGLCSLYSASYSLWLYKDDTWTKIPLWCDYNSSTIVSTLTSGNVSVKWTSGGTPEIFCIGDEYDGDTYSYIPKSEFYDGNVWSSINLGEGFASDISQIASYTVYNWGNSSVSVYPQSVAVSASGTVAFLADNGWITVPATQPLPTPYTVKLTKVNKSEATTQRNYPEMLVSNDSSSIYYMNKTLGSYSWQNLTSSSITNSNILPWNGNTGITLTKISVMWPSNVIGVIKLLCQFSDGSFYYYNGHEWINLIDSSNGFTGDVLSVLWHLNPDTAPLFVSVKESDSSAVYYDKSGDVNSVADINNIESTHNSGISCLTKTGLWNPLGVLPSYVVLTDGESVFHHIYNWLSLIDSPTGIGKVSWDTAVSGQDHYTYGTPEFYASTPSAIGHYLYDNSGSGKFVIQDIGKAPKGKTIYKTFFNRLNSNGNAEAVVVMTDGTVYYYNINNSTVWHKYLSPSSSLGIRKIIHIYTDWGGSAVKTRVKDFQQAPSILVEDADYNFYTFNNTGTAGSWKKLNTLFLFGNKPTEIESLWRNGYLYVYLLANKKIYSYSSGTVGFLPASGFSNPDITGFSSFFSGSGNPVALVSQTVNSSISLDLYTGGTGAAAWTLISTNNKIPSGFKTVAMSSDINASNNKYKAVLGSATGSVLFFDGSAWKSLPDIPGCLGLINNLYVNWGGAAVGNIPQITAVYDSSHISYYNPVLNSWFAVNPKNTESIKSLSVKWPVNKISLPYLVAQFSNNSIKTFI